MSNNLLSQDGNGLTSAEVFVRGAGVTFDDLILLPSFSDVSGDGIHLNQELAPGLVLSLPLISSPMDTVTEWKTATYMALHGGLGIIHFNLNRIIIEGLEPLHFLCKNFRQLFLRRVH